MTLKRRDVLLGLTSLSLPLIAASCSNNSSNPTAQTGSSSSNPAASPVASSAASDSKTVRFGYQKSTILLKSKGTINKRLNAEGVQVEWKEFPAGPPLLDCLA